MKNLFTILILSIGIAFSANAQVTKTQESQLQKEQQTDRITQEVRIQTGLMTELLGLTPEQAERVNKENTNLYSSLNELKTELSEKELSEERVELLQSHESKLQQILTEEQFQKFNDSRRSFYRDLQVTTRE